MNLFGSTVIDVVHDMVHSLNKSNTELIPPNMVEVASADKVIEEDALFHDHGSGYHSHGFTLSLLLRSFDVQKLTSLLQNLRRALQWMLHFPGIIESHDSLPGINLFLMGNNFTTYHIDFHNSTDIDIPTPPPKLILS